MAKHHRQVNQTLYLHRHEMQQSALHKGNQCCNNLKSVRTVYHTVWHGQTEGRMKGVCLKHGLAM